MNKEFFIKNKDLFPTPSMVRGFQHPKENHHPLAGKCFYVSKFLQFYYGYINTTLKCIKNIPNSLGQLSTHWYIIYKDNIIDLTKDQFDFEIDYNKGRRAEFGRKYFRKGKIHGRKYSHIVPNIPTIMFAKRAKEQNMNIRYLEFWVNEYDNFINKLI